MPRDLYETLGVRPTASTDAIKRAYRRLAKRYHPDLNKSRGAKEIFLEVKDAYEVLSNPLLRRQYDERTAGDRVGMPVPPTPQPGAPRKVRVSADYVRVASPFGFHAYGDRLERVRDRQMAKRTRTAQMVWRLYVVTVFSMSGTLAVFGVMALAAGEAFTGGITLGAAAMVLVLLLIAWLAKGTMAPEL
jgi:hypothetical protein